VIAVQLRKLYLSSAYFSLPLQYSGGEKQAQLNDSDRKFNFDIKIRISTAREQFEGFIKKTT